MNIEHSIKVDAPSQLVWDVTKNVEEWPAWAPNITSLKKVDSTPLSAGSEVLIKQPMQSEAKWEVTSFDEGEGFSWKTSKPGLTMVATHTVSQMEGYTLNTLTLEASGYIISLFGFLLKPLFRKALSDENNGLKVYCEQLSEDNQ